MQDLLFENMGEHGRFEKEMRPTGISGPRISDTDISRSVIEVYRPSVSDSTQNPEKIRIISAIQDFMNRKGVRNGQKPHQNR